VPQFGTGALGQHQRHHPEDERERRHQDRTQTQPTGVDNRIDDTLTLSFEVRTRRSGSRSSRPTQLERSVLSA
jgi:hypothetical protein